MAKSEPSAVPDSSKPFLMFSAQVKINLGRASEGEAGRHGREYNSRNKTGELQHIQAGLTVHIGREIIAHGGGITGKLETQIIHRSLKASVP